MSKEQEIIDDIKDFLRENPVVISMFGKFKIPIDQIDEVHIEFADLPVSAKTKNLHIYINTAFLADKEFSDDLHYIVHELCHYLQQYTGEYTKYDYLENLNYLQLPTELEAFIYQAQFMKDFYDEDFRNDYIEDLLDFHDYEGEERDRMRRLILGD